MTETETSRTHILRVTLTGEEHARLSRLWHADGARAEYSDTAEYARRLVLNACDLFEAPPELIDAENPEFDDKLDGLELIDAAKNGNVECVGRLLAMGVDANSADGRGRTPLHAAAETGAVLCINRLLAAAANMDPSQQRYMARHKVGFDQFRAQSSADR